MIDYLRKITSLNNLYRSRRGQVATVLILMMVAVLIFILVTVNLGTISIQATNLSNAADSSALSLGSQLATKSNTLFRSLENSTEKCKKSGWASVVFSVVLAVIAVVVCYLVPVLTPYMIPIAAGAGAVGGAVGGEYAGTGALQGAIQGAVIGASIGYGAGATTVGSGGTTTGAGTAGANTSIAASSTAVAVPVEAGVNVAAGTYVAAGSVIVPASAGAIAANTALLSGAVLYNQSVSERMTSDAFAAAAKALNGLPEYDQYREGAFLQALSQVIDDPNTIADADDTDGDGDAEEKIPYFQFWWDKRIKEFKDIIPTLKSLTSSFINGPLTDSWNFAKGQDTESCVDYGEWGVWCAPAPLARQEVEGTDGAVVEVARGLEDAGYDISFYKPGTPPEDTCEDCDSEYYDKIEAVSGELKNFVSMIDGLKEQDIDRLTSTYQSWQVWFYDPETEWTLDLTEEEAKTINVDWYDVFGNFLEPELNAWKDEIEIKRQMLPQCIYDYDYEDGDSVTNPPCKDEAFGTIDANLDDEFQAAKAAIGNLIAEIQSSRNAFYGYYTDMDKEYAKMPQDYGGINPLTYEWKDSRGEHSITAEVGPFKIPWIRTKKSGGFLRKEICLVLTDYYDDNGARTWVKITRKDPAAKALKSGNLALGKWNPYDNDDPLDDYDSDSDGKFSISRISRVSFSYDNVGIAGK